MSIRYKLFGIFCIVIGLTCGLAFYGIRAFPHRAIWLSVYMTAP
jgi:hypothetical protein